MLNSDKIPGRARLALIAACFFWAISFVASKIALENMPPLTVVTFRMIISALCFAVWFVAARIKIDWKKYWKKFLLLSLFGTSLHYGIQTVGINHTTAANAGVYAVTSPITIALIAWIFLKEKLSGLKITGMLAALAGVLLVIGPDNIAHFSLKGNLLGDMLVMVSIVMWGIFTVLSKDVTAEVGSLELTGAITFIGALMVIPFGIYEMQAVNLSLASVPARAWLAVGFLGVTCSFLATLLYLYALKQAESQKVGVYLYTIPPMTQFFAFMVLSEPIFLYTMAGTALVLFGVWLTERG